MMTKEARLPCAGRRPVSRGERRRIVLIFQAGQAGEEVAQVGERFLAVMLAGDDQGVENRRALDGVVMPEKQPVFLADAGRSQRVLARLWSRRLTA